VLPSEAIGGVPCVSSATIRPTGFGIEAQVVSRYPREAVLASGWLLGEEYLKDRQGQATPVTAAEMGK
jgi:hypothetical protein